MSEKAEANIHASCIAIGAAGVLLIGPSGAGKSDLALRLIDDGARLVADDRTILFIAGGALWAKPPASIRRSRQSHPAQPASTQPGAPGQQQGPTAARRPWRR